MSNKKYTKQFKLDAVNLALSSVKSTVKVAKDLGINSNSEVYPKNGHKVMLLHALHIDQAKNNLYENGDVFDYKSLQNTETSSFLFQINCS